MRDRRGDWDVDVGFGFELGEDVEEGAAGDGEGVVMVGRGIGM
jgi:hypothetical protein